MTSIWQIPAALFTLLAWLTSPSTSLADAAKREAFRRQVTAKSQSAVSNATLPPPRPSDIASASSISGPAAVRDDDEAVPTTEEVAGDVPAPVTTSVATPVATLVVSNEKAWRDRNAELHDTLASDLVLVDSLQTRVASLQNDFFARDDPAQRTAIGEQLAKTRVELDRLKTKVDVDRAAIEKMRDEARRQGVPPGWLR